MANPTLDGKKVFNDPIHGHMEFDSLCVAIIDTPQFQRLRRIKQLGGGYYVYPDASHNRFEHSLGVGYLAGQFATKLRDALGAKNEQEKLITENDIRCLTIAGLCHDLGHGPFSHVFDGPFNNLANLKSKTGSKWKHEQGSVDMFELICENDRVKKELKKFGLVEDLTFIKELINPPDDEENWKGRDRRQFFLYEIVSNKRNEIDVDKWDYFARDCHHLGISNNFDHRRYMEFARVIKDKDDDTGVYRICARDKEALNLYDLFLTRNALHRRAYKHKTKIIVEHMLSEAMNLAKDHLKFSYKKGDGKIANVKLEDTIKDMKAYTQVTDDIVYHMIRFSNSDDTACQEARKILERLENRQLYKFIGQSKPKDSSSPTFSDECKAKMRAAFKEKFDVNAIVKFNSFDFGKGKENPLKDFLFYSKWNGKEAKKLEPAQISNMIPREVEEEYVLVYSKTDESVTEMATFFNEYCIHNGFYEPVGGREDTATDN